MADLNDGFARAFEVQKFALRFLQHPGGLDGAALVPEEENRTGNQHNEAHTDALKSVFEAASIGGCCDFLIGHNKKD